MKSYDEITNGLLERRDRYTAEQKQKKRKMINLTASLCTFCLAALLGLGVWQSGMLQNEPYNQNKFEQTNDPIATNQLRIQEIENMPQVSEKMFIALMWDDFIQMNPNEINEYYGINVFPIVPNDLESKEDQNFGIFKRKTSGEIYYDGNKIQYANKDYSRNVAINIDKDCMPFDFCNLFANIQTRSIINNLEVGIAQTPIGDMYAEFMYQNVGFRIYAYGLTQAELVSIIESVVD